MPNENQTIEYKQLLDNGEPFYPMVGKSSYSEWIGYEEIEGQTPENFVLPVGNGGTGISDFGAFHDYYGTTTVATDTYKAVYTFTGLTPNAYYLASEFIMLQFNTSNTKVTLTFDRGADGLRNTVDYDITQATWHRLALTGIVQADANGTIEVGVRMNASGAISVRTQVLKLR